MQKPLDPMSVERTETPSVSYVLRRRYGSSRHIIVVASWVTAINLLLQPVAVLAGTYYWDTDGATAGAGATPTGTWDAGTTTKWTADSTGASATVAITSTTSDALTFVAGPGASSGNNAYVVTVSGTQNAGTLTFQSSGAATLSGGTVINLNSGITVSQYAYETTANGAHIISTPITLGGSQPWVNNSSSTLTVQTGTLSLGANTLTVGGTGNTTITAPMTVGSGGSLTKNGAGTVTIQNATIPSFSTVTLSGGTLKLSVDAMGTGGTVTQASGKVIHTFLYTGTDDQKSYTLNLPNSVSASVLVVAGGGGGGFGRGGAGGAGGLLYYGAEAPLNGHAEGVAFTIPAGDTSVLVGKGGVANANGFASTLGSLNAVGGGYGGALTIEAPGSTAYQGNIGGSGGGSAGLLSSGIHYTTTGGNGTSGQGSKGGDSVKTTTVGGGGGGGGAGGGGANGTNPSSDNGDGGNGGVGLQYSISGAATWYAGGGGGGAYRNNTAGFRGTGGSGIGGDGGGYSGTSLLLATVGAANTGSGGGGGYNGLAGAAGGSGIVIVNYARFEGSVNLPTTHVDTTASSTLDLTAATADHTLGKFSVAGDQTLTIANANSVTLNGIGTSPTVSIAATGSGTATISGTGITLYPKGDITTSGASLSIGPAVVINSSGTRNVSGNVTMASLDLSSASGSINTGTDKLKISSTLKLQDGAARLVTGTYTAEGTATSFSAQGNDLASNGVGRTLTLSGGKLTLTGADNIGTGGTVTQVGGNVIHTFDNTGADQTSYTLNLPDSVSASVLVVAGGAGGGSARGGGGGAGGLLYCGTETPANGHAEGTSFSISAGNTSVLVGKGGVADANGFASTLGSLNAVGGGYGGTLSNPTQGNTGGSGGGSAGTSITGGSETSGQGSKGGDSNSGGGGGGGAGGGGANGTNPAGDAGNGGNGGAGLQYSISGTATWYAAGGGGGSYYNWNTGGVGGTGGSGIGGAGGGRSSAATTGAANTGSGGGGGYNGLAGAAGGSGIVIVSYALGPSAINLSSTHIDASASSTLDLAAASGNHTLGNVTVTAGAGANTTLTVDKVNSLTIGTLTIGINGKYYGKLDLGTKGLTLGNGSVTKLKVTTVASTVTTEICVAVAANGSFSALDAQVTDDTGNKWTVAVKNSGTELWLTPPPASGTLILFK